MKTVHSFELELDWRLISTISQIDRFDAEWTSIEKKEGQSLKQLKAIATVRSVGASTRIEGSKMSNDEVDVLIKNLAIEKLEDRDSQEVAGYYEVLDIISESYDQIEVSENSLKNLHNILLKHSKKDEWHKGDYKQLPNSVEAKYPDGSSQIIFETTQPGIETEAAMRELISWYENDNQIHSLVKTALFCYEFVSIHPFQDGNGRLSRLLSTLLLLKYGYNWIQYVSFEHEIESRKVEYYQELRKCQDQRPNENVTTWIYFFFDSLVKIQKQLISKLEIQGTQARLSPKEKSILIYISNHPGCKSGGIAKSLDIPSPSAKRMLSELVSKNLIEKFGSGPGTNYAIV